MGFGGKNGLFQQPPIFDNPAILNRHDSDYFYFLLFPDRCIQADMDITIY
jgi:hypothetical protein